MKTEDYLLLAAAGAAVWFILGRGLSLGAAKPVAATAGGSFMGVAEIAPLGGGTFSNGWRYFDDGTAIDPQGCYYFNGARIWCP